MIALTLILFENQVTIEAVVATEHLIFLNAQLAPVEVLISLHF